MRSRTMVRAVLILAVFAGGLSACVEPPPPPTVQAVSFQVTGFAPGLVGTQQITVTALDIDGHVVTGYRGQVRIDAFCSPLDPCTPSDPAPLVPAPYTFTAADAGAHTFSVTIRLAKPGGQSYYVQATDTAHSAITGQQIRWIRPGTATRIDMTPYDPTPVLAVGQILPKSTITVKAYDQYGNLSSDPSLDFDFSTIGFPDNYQDMVDYPRSVALTGGQTTMVVPTPGMVHTPGVVTTSFYLKKPGTSGAGLIYGQADVTVTSTAANLNPVTLGGYVVQPNGSMIISGGITLPPAASYTITAVDLGSGVVTAGNGSTTLQMAISTPVTPFSGDLYLSNNYPQTGSVVTVSGSIASNFDPVIVTPGIGAVTYVNGGQTYFGTLFNATATLH